MFHFICLLHILSPQISCPFPMPPTPANTHPHPLLNIETSHQKPTSSHLRIFRPTSVSIHPLHLVSCLLAKATPPAALRQPLVYAPLFPRFLHDDVTLILDPSPLQYTLISSRPLQPTRFKNLSTRLNSTFSSLIFLQPSTDTILVMGTHGRHVHRLTTPPPRAGLFSHFP